MLSRNEVEAKHLGVAPFSKGGLGDFPQMLRRIAPQNDRNEGLVRAISQCYLLGRSEFRAGSANA